MTTCRSFPGAATILGGMSNFGLLNEKDVIRKAGKDRIKEFLQSHVCYDLLKTSGKVVVFDSSIPVQLAFYALVEHGEFLRLGFSGSPFFSPSCSFFLTQRARARRNQTQICKRRRFGTRGSENLWAS